MAKQQAPGGVASAEQQQKKAKPQAKQNCHLSAPPFMYNPRFMNRGFFKKKCTEPNE